MRDPNKARLYCVAVPIGNPTDITERARSILAEATVIAAEDTRVFKELCRDAKITTNARVVSYYDAKEIEKAEEIFALLQEGETVAIVSDAGTPNIYDPGFRILAMAFANDIEVIPVPGASSVTAALSICPLPGLNFCFFGFPPSGSNARKKLFQEISFEGRVVFFESPHRIVEHLEDAREIWGDEQALFICRELTKKFEEKAVKTVSQWLAHFAEVTPKGEFVLIYDGSKKGAPKEDLDQWLQDKIDAGVSSREILKEAQTRFKMNRKDIYNKITKKKKK